MSHFEEWVESYFESYFTCCKPSVYAVFGRSYGSARKNNVTEAVTRLAERDVPDQVITELLNGVWDTCLHHVENGKLVWVRVKFHEERKHVLRFISIRDTMANEQGLKYEQWYEFTEEVLKFPPNCSRFFDRVRENIQTSTEYRASFSKIDNQDDLDEVRNKYYSSWYELCLLADAIIAPQEQGRNAFLNNRPRGSCPYSVNPLVPDSNAEDRVRAHRDVWFDGYDTEARMAGVDPC